MHWLYLKYCLVLLLFITVQSQSQTQTQNQTKTKSIVIPTYKKGGWNFWTFFIAFKNLIADQYTDTKDTLNQANDLVKDTFSDTATTKRTTPGPITEPTDNTTTTTEKYRVSRYEFGRILGRNYRGLQKIFRDDLNSALNQSNYNIEGYKQEWKNAVGTPAPKVRGKSNGSPKKRRKITTTAPKSFFGF